MVAETITLPNLREMFIPDPGKCLIDCDLERADAQVVAWEAGDDELKAMFKERVDVHTENAKAIFGIQKPTYEQRHKAKGGVHAVNYYVKARTLAAHLGITVKEAEDFINRWFSAHPNIKKWHERIMRELQTSHSVRNAFGYRIYFFDRINEQLLPKALGWIPQSTVGLVINHGLVRVAEQLSEVDLLLQVHDSLVMQCLIEDAPRLAPEILKLLHVTVPYDDPLTIQVSLDVSLKSWGDVKSTVYQDNKFYWKPDKDDEPVIKEVEWLNVA